MDVSGSAMAPHGLARHSRLQRRHAHVPRDPRRAALQACGPLDQRKETSRMHLTRRTVALGAAALASSLLAPAAWAQKQYDPGASDTEILLGMPMPLSGPVSGYAIIGKVAEGYFKKLNEQGGIHGRKVKLLVYDDQYSPPKTVEVARRMVEQDQILAWFSSLGTASNLAIQRYMNTKKVPHLFLQTGASQFDNAKQFPWTTPMLGSYRGEGKVFAKHIVQHKPGAKIALLMQNDDMGREVLKGLQEGLAGKSASLVSQATFEVTDPTVDSQIVQLKASGADVLVLATTAQALRKVAELGWTPERYVNIAGASVKMALEPAGADKAKGTISLAYYKDPGSKQWDSDAEMKAYKELLKTYAPGVDPNNSTGVTGYVAAQLMAHVLRECGDNLTRENIRRLATNLKNPKVELLLPGVQIASNADDLHAVAAMQPVRYNGQDMEAFGAVESLK
jgi:branched-chain amino acid transport system substrate-binding protein